MYEEPAKNNSTKISMVVNAIAQIFIIFLFLNYQIVWPLYIAMFAIGIIMFMQTIASIAVLSRSVENERKKTYSKDEYSVATLVTLIYFISCYTLYIAGFSIFALLAIPHLVIMFFVNLIGALRK